MKQQSSYTVIGLMSGTSLDGLDVALCNFSFANGRWKYKILCAKTYSYAKRWKEKLSSVESKSAEEFAMLHSEYGHFLGEMANEFVKRQNIKVDFISSHGHTIFHQPKKKFTFQLGSGAAIAAESGLPVVCDFRTTDIALGGQGAPLVPIGDKLLFADFDFCLNLGGIANLTAFISNKKIVAYDVCPANMALNFLAQKLGKEYDRNGEIARGGKLNENLLSEFNSLKYFSAPFPKSLGKEWVVKEFLPLLNRSKITTRDKFRTLVEHIAFQIAAQISQKSNSRERKLLITGGGAHNKFLIDRISFHLKSSNVVLQVPEKLTVDFKEALIFAFLGVLRWRGENNCLASVTGAKRNNCGGAIYLP